MAETTRHPLEASPFEKSLMAITVVGAFVFITYLGGWPVAVNALGWTIALGGCGTAMLLPLFFQPFFKEFISTLIVIAFGCVLLFTGKAHMEPIPGARHDTTDNVVTTEDDAPAQDTATTTDDDTECGYYCTLQRDYNARNP